MPMKHLTKKDFVILTFCYIFFLATVELPFLVDETSLEGRLSLALSLTGAIGFYLALPIHFVSHMAAKALIFLGVIPSIPFGSLATLLPWSTATVYTLLLALILSRLNANK